MAIGLVFFGIGDFCLHMEKDPVNGKKIWFLIGLGSFLIGHIFMMLRLSFRLTELKCDGSERFNLAFVGFLIIFVLFKILPNIKDDKFMQNAVVLYTFVIGRMFYFSLVLSKQEEKYYFSL